MSSTIARSKRSLSRIAQFFRLEVVLLLGFTLLFLFQLTVDFFFLPPTAEKLAFPGKPYFLSSLFLYLGLFFWFRKKFRNDFVRSGKRTFRAVVALFCSLLFCCVAPLVAVALLSFLVQLAYVVWFGLGEGGVCPSVVADVTRECTFAGELKRVVALTTLNLPVFFIFSGVALVLESVRFFFALLFPRRQK